LIPCDRVFPITLCRYGAWVVPRAPALSSGAFVTVTILPSLRAVRISGQLTNPPASAITSCLISDQSSINSNFLFDLGLSWPFARSVPISALQLQLLVAGKLTVTVSTQLYPAGELQGPVELLTCYDGAGSASPGGNHLCSRCLFHLLTHLQSVLFLFLPLFPLSEILLLSFLRHRQLRDPLFQILMLSLCKVPHLFFSLLLISMRSGNYSREIQQLARGSVLISRTQMT